MFYILHSLRFFAIILFNNILLVLQWFLISIPNIIVPGKIVVYFQYGNDMVMHTYI